MAKVTSFLAGAAIGVAAGAAVGAVFRPDLRTLARTALTGYYVGKRRVAELAALVTEELEDLHAEVVSEERAAQASSTVSADAAGPTTSEQASQAQATIDDGQATACEQPVEHDEHRYKSMSVGQLRAEFINLGIEIGSRVKKADLIERLRSVTSEA